MNRLLVLAAVFVASVAVAAPTTVARNSTTSPGYNFSIRVLITGKTVTLDRSVARRGWRAHFIVRNRDNKAHRFELGGLRTKSIAPGKKSNLGAFLENRGTYPYKIDNKVRGYFTVI